MNSVYKNIAGMLELPVRIGRDCDYLPELEKTYKKYTGLLIDSKLPIEVVQQVNVICGDIVNAVKAYYNGQNVLAQQTVLDILLRYKDNKLVVSDLNESYAFRGMTPFYVNEIEHERNKELNFFKARLADAEEVLERKDMLHIPFDRRGIVKTQRFSIPGVPCLYLGTSSYVCWLELGKPQNSRFNVASYKFKRELKVLNLALCWNLLSGTASGIDYKIESSIQDDSIIETCLFLLPLIIATSFVVADRERVFKSEYIVSQLIMTCLSDINVDAVAYISKRVKLDYIGFPNAVNLAVPMKCVGKELVSEQCKQIELTEPFNFEEFCKLNLGDRWSPVRSYITENFGFNKIVLSGQLLEYRNTIFSEFDNYLINRPHRLYEKDVESEKRHC